MNTKNGAANKVTIASLLVALGIIYGTLVQVHFMFSKQL
jgi:hypothetical protein